MCTWQGQGNIRGQPPVQPAITHILTAHGLLQVCGYGLRDGPGPDATLASARALPQVRFLHASAAYTMRLATLLPFLRVPMLCAYRVA